MKKFFVLLSGIICVFALSLLAACDGGSTGAEVVESLTITNGESLTAYTDSAPVQLDVKIQYSDEAEKAATSEDVAFSSNNHAAATVSAKGLITIAGEGTAEITVESKMSGANGRKVSRIIELEIKAPPVVESVTVTNGTSLTAIEGDAPIQLSVKIKYVGETEKAATGEDVTFASSSESVATVNNGLITLRGIGETTVTIESKRMDADGDKIVKTLNLTVRPAVLVVESMTLTSDASYSVICGLNADFEVGGTTQITLNIKYVGEEVRAATSEDITFLSDDPTVATVDADGQITFKGAVGTSCVITVKSKKAKQGGGFMEQTVNVEVKEPVAFPNIIIAEQILTPDNYFLVKFKNASTSAITFRKYVLVFCLDASNNVLETMILYRDSGGPITATVSPNYITPYFIDKDEKLCPAGTVKLIVIDNKDSVEDLMG
jgi:uncharacterized protein YjdB